MAYLYRHVRLDKNEVFYIGIGSDRNFKRAYEKTNRNRYWKNTVNKSAYEVEILLEDLTWEEACKKEVEFIILYGRSDLGIGTLCNLTNGGEGVLGMKHTEKVKNKIKEDSKNPERLATSKENLKKASTEESKRKRVFNTDYSFNKDPRVIAKRKASTDYEKIGLKKSKPVLQYTLDGIFIKEWVSAYKAYKESGYNFGHISSCCRGIKKTYNGYIWKYKLSNN